MKMMAPALIVIMSIFSTSDKLTGRWETKPSPKGNVTGVVFKPDNTYEGYINRKPFVTGFYTLSNDTISIVENGCSGKKGIYKLVFFSNNDSLRFEHVMDSCDERRNGMVRTILGKVK